MSVEGSWAVHTVDGAEVRLRSGKVGLMDVEVSAPVSGGELQLTAEAAEFTLLLALDQLRTNFFIQTPARMIVTRNDAHVLRYQGAGPASAAPWQVTGHAKAGSVDVELTLAVTPCGPEGDPMAEIAVKGSASLGTVHLPLPGIGTVDDFSFDVDARLALRRRG